MQRVLRFVCLSVVILLIPLSIQATTGSGFVQASVWFSDTTYTEGATLTIYEAIFNDTAIDIEATVQFEDGEKILGIKTISIPPHSVREASILWVLTPGTHYIGARILSPSPSFDGRTETIPIKVTVPKKIFSDDQELPETAQGVLASVNLLQEEIASAIPDSLRVWITKIFAKVEDVRINTATFFQLQKNKVENDLQLDLIETVHRRNEQEAVNPETIDDQQYFSSSSTNHLKMPLNHLKVFLYSLGEFIFRSAMVFYTFFGLLLIVLIRSCIKLFY